MQNIKKFTFVKKPALDFGKTQLKGWNKFKINL